jgi:excisionase family DNA binding protein
METVFLSARDAAKYLDISMSHLYKLTSQGLLPHHKPAGKKLYFTADGLAEYITGGASIPSPAERQADAVRRRGVSK